MRMALTTLTPARPHGRLLDDGPHAQSLTPHQQLARDIYKELVEINTVTATGDTLRAAEAMAARLRAAGFDRPDVQVFSPAPRKGNLVARLRGTGARKPILLLAHIDVVEARREDWSTDPFKLIEKDGYFYGRGTADDKFMAAAFVANLIRYKQEGFRPDRDIILALETDEEILDRDALGIQWLLKNHRALIDAEFALNEGGGVGLKNGKPMRNTVQTSEKVSVSYRLEVKNPGGHSSLPGRDNAIYRLAEGLARLAKFSFPFKLNETTRAFFERIAELETAQIAADMRVDPIGHAGPGRASLCGCPPTRSTTRSCARPASPRCWRAGMPSTRCRSRARHRQLPHHAGRAGRGSARRRWCACSPTSRSPSRRSSSRCSSAPSALHEEIMGAIAKLSAEFWPGVPVVPDHERRRDRRQLPAQRRDPDLRPFRARERHRRRARPRPGRTRAGRLLLAHGRSLYQLVKMLRPAAE